MEESSPLTDTLKKKKQKNDIIQRQTLVLSSSAFIKKSLNFIYSKMSQKKLIIERGRRYIKEILHSIFFICYIYQPPIHPRDILQSDMFSDLSKEFPDVFESYESQLPVRPPYSILLDVVVETTRDQDVLSELARFNDEIDVSNKNDFCFGATVVSCSYFKRSDLKTRNYFGASMSCKGRTATRIFIYVACIETWNRNIAHAVCLANKYNKSITWPVGMYSTAYKDLSHKRGDFSPESHEESPCLLCCKIFQNVTFSPPATAAQKKPSWNYGNCAECEAFSNLLNGETSVNEETQDLNTDLEPSLETLRRKIEEHLRGYLEKYNVVLKRDSRFYNPK